MPHCPVSVVDVFHQNRVHFPPVFANNLAGVTRTGNGLNGCLNSVNAPNEVVRANPFVCVFCLHVVVACSFVCDV